MEFELPHACAPVSRNGGDYYTLHVEDHIFQLNPSDATEAAIETFAAALAARLSLHEHLETLNKKGVV